MFSILVNNYAISNSEQYICMLTKVISSNMPKKRTVVKLISWKHSFERLNEEYELAQKKKEALDNLYETGRISKATHESFNSEIAEAMAEIEKQQKNLVSKFHNKAEELETHIRTLEILLANYEIKHVAGEIDDEVYEREINLFTTGLETVKRERDRIKEAEAQLLQPVEMPADETWQQPESEGQGQVNETLVCETESVAAIEACSEEQIANVEVTLPETPDTEPEAVQTENPEENITETPTELSIEAPTEQTEYQETNTNEADTEPEVVQTETQKKT